MTHFPDKGNVIKQNCFIILKPFHIKKVTYLVFSRFYTFYKQVKMVFTANYILHESQRSCLFWGTVLLMNTSLGRRTGNSQTNDFIISTWYSGRLLHCGSYMSPFHASIWKKAGPKTEIKELKKQNRVLRSRQDDVNTDSVSLHIPNANRRVCLKATHTLIWGWRYIRRRTVCL